MTSSDQFALEPRDFPLCLASPQCPADQRQAYRTLFDHLGVCARGDDTSTAELLAVADSKPVVRRARPELTARTGALVTAHSGARAALHRLEVFVEGGETAAARDHAATVAADYASDGPHRRSRRLIPGRLADGLILAAALFDTVFLGSLFRFLVDADPDTAAGRVALVIAYVPGVVLAAALMLTGLWFGQAVERHHERGQGGPGADRVPRTYWGLPAGLAVLSLTTVGVAAWARPMFLQAGGVAQVLPTWVVVLLLVTLSITAIAAKIMATNSHADAEEAAERRRRRAADAGAKLLTTAERAVHDHEQRWQELRGSVGEVISDVEDLWAAVARHRGPTVIDGVVLQGGVAPDTQFARLVQHTPVPPPAAGPVLNAGQVLNEYRPSGTRADLNRLRRALTEQGVWRTEH